MYSLVMYVSYHTQYYACVCIIQESKEGLRGVYAVQYVKVEGGAVLVGNFLVHFLQTLLCLNWLHHLHVSPVGCIVLVSVMSVASRS